MKNYQNKKLYAWLALLMFIFAYITNWLILDDIKQFFAVWGISYLIALNVFDEKDVNETVEMVGSDNFKYYSRCFLFIAGVSIVLSTLIQAVYIYEYGLKDLPTGLISYSVFISICVMSYYLKKLELYKFKVYKFEFNLFYYCESDSNEKDKK